MTEQEQPKQQENEQADLEVAEEQAEEVEGGLARGRGDADRDSQGVRFK
jgi:hypothetical protein